MPDKNGNGGGAAEVLVFVLLSILLCWAYYLVTGEILQP